MKNVTICILLVIATLMTAGCGKFHSCECSSYTTWDIVDTALADSVQGYPISGVVFSTRESAMECTYWSSRDTVGSYIPEYGIRTYYVFECWEK
jgi:hypothetical protein